MVTMGCCHGDGDVLTYSKRDEAGQDACVMVVSGTLIRCAFNMYV